MKFKMSQTFNIINNNGDYKKDQKEIFCGNSNVEYI